METMMTNETDKPEDAHRVSGSELSGLVMRVLQTGKPQKLSAEDTARFHSKFAAAIHPFIEKHRRLQRLAFSKLHCSLFHYHKCKAAPECWDCECLDCGRTWVEEL